MKQDNTERIRARILALIESEFESDAAFERAMGLGDKTVNNWRRARSSSFMNMLPRLSETFKVNIGELMDMPLRSQSISTWNLKLVSAFFALTMTSLNATAVAVRSMRVSTTM